MELGKKVGDNLLMTLNLGLLSDVHAHRHDQAEALAALIDHINAQPAPDLLLLAGDVSHRTAELERFLGSLRADCPRCWVPGNHDVWVIDPESADDSAELRYGQRFAAISEAHGWHYLPPGPRILHELGVAVVGTLGWFSGWGFSEWFDQQSTERDQELARRLADELEASIAGVPPELRLIVVTHHVSHDGVPTLDPAQTNLHSRFLQRVLLRHRARIDLVVHGHRHERYGPTEIEGLRFVAHPFGYPGQHAGPEDGYRTVRVGTGTV